MNQPVEMTKIRLTGLKSQLPKVIDILYELRLLHIVDFDKNVYEGLDYGKPFDSANQFSDHLVKVKAVQAFFGKIPPHEKPRGGEHAFQDLEKNQARFGELFEHFSALSGKLSALEARASDLRKRLREPAGFIGGGGGKRDPSTVEFISGMVEKDVRTALQQHRIDFELVSENTSGGKTAIALFVPKRQAVLTRTVLQSAGFSEAKIAENPGMKKLRQELDEVEKEMELERNKLAKLGRDHQGFFSHYATELESLNEKAECPLRFGMTGNAFVATGFVPSQKANEMERVLLERIGKTIHMEYSNSKKGAPTLLQNPAAIRPFEFFLQLYTLPKYSEIDPTIIMSITFPLFFGFMLGDMGYGIVLLALFLFLRNRTTGILKALTGPLIWSSVGTIFFGFIFGEFFGAEVIHPILNRVHDPTLILGIAVLVGFIHLNLGFLVGFFNEKASHGIRQAVLGKLSWLILEFGILLIGLDAMGVVSMGGPLIGGIVALAAVVMIYLGEGAKGLVELPAILSNVLSYGRLFAVGLSSVSLALVVNQMAGSVWEGGVLGMALGIVILVLGHVLNLALGLLGPSLHAIRLHYVEFFSKFYHGGGTIYRPFGQKEENE